jgi:predicted nucleic acid-binding protein
VSEPLTFVDTNVLVYAHDASDPERHARAMSLLRRLWADRAGVVSTQVLAELYSVLTRKLGMSSPEAREIVLLYAAWPVVQVDVPLLAAAMERHGLDGLAWWDAMVVEAGLRAGVERLASEDFGAGRRFGAMEVLNPLAAQGPGGAAG